MTQHNGSAAHALEDDRRPTKDQRIAERAERTAIAMSAGEPQAEQSVISCVLTSDEAAKTARSLLEPTDFQEYRHQVLYSAAQEMHQGGIPCDAVTVTQHLQKTERLLEVAPTRDEAVSYLCQTLEFPAYAKHVRYYADIVKDRSLRRQIKERLLSAAQTTDDPSIDIETLIKRPNFADLILPEQSEIKTLRQLSEAHPDLYGSLIEGILRRCEVANIIAPSKIGKSWLTYNLAHCVNAGMKWFGFKTNLGPVLIIDNELHEPTIWHRIRAVGDAMELKFDDYADAIKVWPMRGRAENVFSIGQKIDRLRERFALVILDAKYRSMPAGTSENDNASETAFYNEIDRWARSLNCAVALVHHSGKGGQSEKRVTDVGSGAGAQSRAADTHLVLREHEEPNTFVLEAAVRSFAPVEPIGLRWVFPLWVSDESVDVAKLKGGKSRVDKQAMDDQETDIEVLRICETWKNVGDIERESGGNGKPRFGKDRIRRSVERLTRKLLLDTDKQDRDRHKNVMVYRRSVRAHNPEHEATASSNGFDWSTEDGFR